MGAVFIITKFKTESPTVIKNGKRKRPAPNRHGSKIKSAASQKNSGVVAAPTGVAEIVQEEVCIVPAPPVCLLPVCSYAHLTAYCGILPTRSPILPERDLTPSSSARGATLAVLASFVSRILPGQEYSIVTAIAAGGAYCNAPSLIPQGQKRKMFLMAEKFLKLFFDIETATRLFTVGWRCVIAVRQTGICQPNCFLISAFTLSKSLQVKIGISRLISSMLLSHHLNLSSNSISSSSKRF